MSTNQNKINRDSFFMSLALNQAMINLGNTKENPSVGCVITKNNSVVSAGYTSLNGRPHAEFNAINKCKENLINSNLYVTLEPCSHYGKTPPCVKKIIKSKVKKVFFSIKDPDLRSYNNSSKILKKKQINVNIGILSNKISHFYKSYILSKRNKLPFVTCKLATSKDLFTINKKKKWITNEYSRGRVHLLRSYNDCLITSATTINKDNPRLTCRISGLLSRSPARVILDKNLKINLNSKVISESLFYKTIIFYNNHTETKIRRLKRFNIKLYKVPLDSSGNIDLNISLFKIKSMGYSRIFLESGITLTKAFFDKGLIDDFKLFISDKKIGKNGSGNIGLFLKSILKNKRNYIEKVNLFGEKLISYQIK